MNDPRFEEAIKAHRAGALDVAEERYQSFLALHPEDIPARFYYGVLLHDLGRWNESEAMFTAAIERSPQLAEAHAYLGLVYQATGRIESAVASLQRSVSMQPQNAELHRLFGNALMSANQPGRAVEAYRQAIRYQPLDPQSNFGIACGLQACGQHFTAQLAYRRALDLKPDYLEALTNLGILYQNQGYPLDALAMFRRGVEQHPQEARAWLNLGIAYQELEDLGQAAESLRQAQQLAPDHPSVLHHLGGVLLAQGAYVDAARAFERLIELQPEFEDAYFNLGLALQQSKNGEGAIRAYERAVAMSPRFQRLLLIHQLQHECRWEGIEQASIDLVRSLEAPSAPPLLAAESPFYFLSLPIPTSPAQQLHFARRWTQSTVPTASQALSHYRRARLDSPQRRIRLGYLSADFADHVMAYHVVELLEEHDRSRFEVFGYSLGPPDQSAIRRRIERGVDHFRPLENRSYFDIAQQIDADEIDILIDLQGYTTLARPRVLALRPAPIQVSYLGYPGTTGSTFIDYILVDEYLVPREQQAFFSERLVYIPGCYQVNDSRQEVSKTVYTRSQCALPDEAFVFCSFNHYFKLTPRMFSLWLRILQQVERGVLWLPEGSPAVHQTLRSRAEVAGVDPARLVFAPFMRLPEHIARHRLADLYLDTFPYNAHGTASIALRAGVPLVTLSGESMASRVAGSLLNSIGLSSLIAKNEDEYLQLAVELAHDSPSMQSVRRQVVEGAAASGLFDGKAFARKVEQAYLKMIASQPEGNRF